MFNFFFRPYVPGFHVGPHDDVPGFNIDENGSPRRGAWSDGMLPDAAMQRYLDMVQAATPHPVGFPTPGPEAMVNTTPPLGLGGFRPSPQADVPGFKVKRWDDVPGFNFNEDSMLNQFPVAEDPIQSAPPQLPEWLYKVATILPQLTALDPLTGRHIAIRRYKRLRLSKAMSLMQAGRRRSGRHRCNNINRRNHHLHSVLRRQVVMALPWDRGSFKAVSRQLFLVPTTKT